MAHVCSRDTPAYFFPNRASYFAGAHPLSVAPPVDGVASSAHVLIHLVDCEHGRYIVLRAPCAQLIWFLDWMSNMTSSRTIAILIACLGLAARVSAHAQSVNLTQAIELAQQHSPGLQALQQQQQAAQALVASSDDLPSPKLTLGHVNQPITGGQAWQLNNSMMSGQRIALQQALPSADKRQALQQVAQQHTELLEKQWVSTRVEIEQAVATAWLTVYFAHQKRAVIAQLRQQNQNFAQAIQVEIGQNQRPLADAVLAEQQDAAWQDQLDTLQMHIVQAHVELQRWTRVSDIQVDVDADWTLPPLPLSDLQQSLAQHAVLGVAQAEVNLAQARVQQSLSLNRPDWAVEVAYQHRDAQFGNLLSLQLSVDLPMFRRAQIQAEQEAAQLRLNAQQHQQEELYLKHQLHLRQQSARLTTLAQQLERLHQTHFPLAQQRLDLAQAGYASRQLSLGAVIQARLDLLQQRYRMLELQEQQATITTQLRILHQSHGGNRQ